MEQNFKGVLSGYVISEEGNYLLLDDVLSKELRRVKFSIRDKIFTLIKENRNFCVGRYDLSTLDSFPCPNKKELISDGKVCPDCTKFNSFNPAFYNASSISKKQEEYNAQPHVVYLVNFGEGINKVGISNYKRSLTRLLEQGARSAYIIKEHKNADDARYRERAISELLDVKESLQRSSKKKLIQQSYDPAKARQELDNIIDKVKKMFPGDPVDTEKFYYLDGMYLDSNTKLKKIIHEVNSDFISGKYVGLIGDILILEQKGQQFMLSLKDFMGKLVEISNEERPYDNIIQGSLF